MAQTFGKYELIEQIGRGAFATVHRAKDITLDRLVALKVLHPMLLTDPEFVHRFQREAKTMATLEHRYIVIIYEIGDFQGQVFIAMALVNGPNLAQAILDHGSYTLIDALALLEPISQALDYAHSQGVIHRDLKPANILLDQSRTPQLTDFGFARLVSLNSASVSLSGGIIGTPAYIAPEIWEGEPATVASDLYSLGCIAYELVTGKVLFAGDSPMQVMRAHDKGPQFSAEEWAALPPELEQILRKALHSEPNSRYPSARAFWYALQDLERKAQMTQAASEQAKVAAQWQAETEQAIAEEEWKAAKKAIGRWLAVAPDDPAAKAVQAKITQQLTPPAVKPDQPSSPPLPEAVHTETEPVKSQTSPLGPPKIFSYLEANVKWLVPLAMFVLIVGVALGMGNWRPPNMFASFSNDATEKVPTVGATKQTIDPSPTSTPKKSENNTPIAQVADTKTPRPVSPTPTVTRQPTSKPTNTLIPPTKTPKPPSPTPTVSRTPPPISSTNTPVPSAQTSPGVIFEEGFSSNENGWQTGSASYSNGDATWEFVDGKYRQSIIYKDWGHVWSFSVPNVSVKDFVFSTDVSIVEATDVKDYTTMISIRFRSQDKSSYWAQFSNAGYRLGVYDASGDWKIIKDFAATDAFRIEPGLTNSFGVSAKGPRIGIIANNQELFALEDQAWDGEGTINVFVMGQNAGQRTTLDFDNILVREPN